MAIPPITQKSREEVLAWIKTASVEQLDEVLEFNDHDYGSSPCRACIVEIRNARDRRARLDMEEAEQKRQSAAESAAQNRHREVMGESSKATRWARVAGIAGVVAAIGAVIAAVPIVQDWLNGSKDKTETAQSATATPSKPPTNNPPSH